jgi:ferric-dicitrate binding protein FerR (iron transport regulator)
MPHLERALESSFKELRAAEPDTAQQWRILQAALRSRNDARPTHVKHRALRPALAVGLAVACILMIVLLPDRNASLVEYETGRGQHTTIILADSSEITLNHTSTLTLGGSSGDASRLVKLEGEAFFQVRRTGAPFIVTTDLGTVRVLGTEFNVRKREDRLEVAVVQGSVRVESESTGAEDAVVVETGELTMRTRGDALQNPARFGNSDYPGWVHGKLSFYRAGLADACREIGDYFDVAVAIELPQGDGLTITGAIDARTPEAAIATLARLTGTRYRHDQSVYTLY